MITINNLNFGYDKHQEVLTNINLQLPEGHIYGILGKNGIGKSTLLKLLSGALLCPGTCLVDGLDPSDRSVDVEQLIRLLPEEQETPNVTIFDLARITAPFYPKFDFDLLNNALKEFEVPADKQLTHMSLGQHKKALIALSLACNTPYLFCDEVTNGLDIISKGSFRRLVASMADEKKTVLISTHQIDDVDVLIDAVVILDNHGVLLSATLEEIGRKLCFCNVEPQDQVLYSEPTLSGLRGIVLNETGQESPVDTKLLFAGVVRHPEVFQSLFQPSADIVES